MEEIVSVIVPVYNTEKYLRQCVDSIINQTYSNLEIILVDDGSTDKSGEICDDYGRIDNRVKVVHKPNGGQSSARNHALNICSGEYVSFIDSDDWLELDMYERLVTAIKEENAQVAICDIIVWENNRNTKAIHSSSTGKKVILKDNDDIFFHFVKPNPLIKFEEWNKLYRRDIIGNVRFVEGQLYEELFFDRIVFDKVSKLVAISTALYNYRLNRPGGTNSSFNIKRLSKLEELDKYVERFKSKGRADICRAYQIYAVKSTIALYRLAYKHGASCKTKKALKLKYNDYYKESGIRGWRFLLFYYKPFLYNILAEVSNLMSKIR